MASLRHPPLNWYSFHYTATDPDGLYDSISLRVKHFNCKETLSVQENKPKDTVVGSVGGPNKADGSSFSLGGDVATYFDIDSSTGQITVKDGTTLDYETKTSYSGNFRYTVENTSVGGDIQINVNDVRAPNVDRPTLAQNATNPTTALDVSWTAPTPMTGTTLNDYGRAVPRVGHQHVDRDARHHQQLDDQHHHHRPHRGQGVRGAGALPDRRRGPRPLVRGRPSSSTSRRTRRSTATSAGSSTSTPPTLGR